MEWVYGSFILAAWRALESWKDGKNVNVLCIVDQCNQRAMVVVDHSRDFKDI